MELEKEIEGLFKEDPNKALYPIDNKMKFLEDLGVEGMSSENIRYIINYLVKNYAKTYLEVGTYKGCSLISAKYKNDARCIAIDNFSQFLGKNPKRDFKSNMIKANIDIEFYEGDYRHLIPNIFKKEPNLKIDVYFYDGDHSYENQLNGLNIIKPYLADKCIIIVDDAAWPDPNKANLEWLSQNKDFKSILYSHYTPEEWIKGDKEFKSKVGNSGHGWPDHTSPPKWWNGLRLFWRGI